MAGYRVIIRGHLDGRKRPTRGWESVGMPEDPRQVFNVDATSDAQLGNFIDSRMADIVSCNAMKVELNPDKKELGKLRPWVTIPMSTLTHLSFEVINLAGEVPVYDKERGEAVGPKGKKVMVN